MKNPKGTLRVSEIAEILKLSKKAVYKREKKQGWASISLPRKGGSTRFIIIDKLPEPTRSELIGSIPLTIPIPKTASKIEKSIIHLKRALTILEELKNDGFEKKEINRILSLAKQSLRMPRNKISGISNKEKS